jgi:hypothetical protein
MSTLKLTTLSNQSGSASVPSDTVIKGSAKAWVNFNGTGTVAIRAGFNVSSITDRGNGLYTINFTTSMIDTSYSIAGNSTNAPSYVVLGNYSAAGYDVGIWNHYNAWSDADSVCIATFR